MQHRKNFFATTRKFFCATFSVFERTLKKWVFGPLLGPPLGPPQKRPPRGPPFLETPLQALPYKKGARGGPSGARRPPGRGTQTIFGPFWPFFDPLTIRGSRPLLHHARELVLQKSCSG
jgi:hypothetical protein